MALNLFYVQRVLNRFCDKLGHEAEATFVTDTILSRESLLCEIGVQARCEAQVAEN